MYKIKQTQLNCYDKYLLCKLSDFLWVHHFKNNGISFLYCMFKVLTIYLSDISKSSLYMLGLGTS